MTSLSTRSQPGSRGPGDEATPIVSDKRKALNLERIRQRLDVADQLVEPVGGNSVRLVARIVAALVGNDDAKPGCRERTDLVYPSLPEIRKAVQQDDVRTIARTGLHDVQPHAVGGCDRIMLECEGRHNSVYHAIFALAETCE
jgi:hypothetical protein